MTLGALVLWLCFHFENKEAKHHIDDAVRNGVWYLFHPGGGAASNPLAASMGNFARVIIPTLVLSIIFISKATLALDGIAVVILFGKGSSTPSYAE